MAAADGAAVESGTPASVLMERAGRAVARAAIRVAGGRYGRYVAVVCGKGNNGGDGLVAARVLLREGVVVRCLTVGETGSSKGAAADHLAELQRSGGGVEPFTPAGVRSAEVVVDALFGTGFKGRVEGEAAGAIASIGESGSKVVAVDIPSGVTGASGAVEGLAVRADVTVAMGAEKLGTALAPGAAYAGRVEIADIGIPIDQSRATAFMCEVQDVAAILPQRRVDAHKRSGGAVALLVGSEEMPGAAVLAARGTVRAGAGYATVGSTPAVAAAVGNGVPEVLSTILTGARVLGPESLAAFAPVIDRAGVVTMGPGIGRGEAQAALVERALTELHLPVVLDADGLNVLATRTEVLTRRSHPTIITPHPAELARLLERSVEEVQSDRLASAREAARTFDCVVLLKGYRTVVAGPEGRAVVNPTGGPELATAGTGDVLTGAVSAMLAAGLDPFSAGWASAYVHGFAGSIAAERLGRAGVLAGDVVDALPLALGRIGDGMKETARHSLNLCE